MALTRHEQLYYNNIERIATALEKLVAQGEQGRLDQFKQATNLIYGNSKSPLKNNPGSGRSDDNYTYLIWQYPYLRSPCPAMCP